MRLSRGLFFLLFSTVICVLVRADETKEWEAARAAVRDQHYSDARNKFEALLQKVPLDKWQDEDRYLLGSAYYASGASAKAQQTWGALLCENPSGSWTFRTAYDLAKSWKNEGRNWRAQAALQFISNDALEKQSSSQKQAYRRLVRQLNKGLAVNQASARPNEELPGLTVRPRGTRNAENAAGQPQVKLDLTGRYLANDTWELTCGSVDVPRSEAGEFEIALIVENQSALLRLAVFGPQHQVEYLEKAFLLADWKNFPPLATNSAATEDEGPRPRIDWLDFQFGVLANFQPSIWLTVAPRFAWSPHLSFGTSNGMRLTFGVAPLRRTDGALTAAMDYTLAFTRDIQKLLQLEAGAGAQTWLNYGATRGVVRASIGWLIGRQIVTGFSLDRFVLGYSYTFASGDLQAMFLGGGFKF